jgi:hypothetical protein
MRLSDLLHRLVVDEQGRPLGHVEDVHVVQDGPVVAGFGALLRVDGLVVGRAAALGLRLGVVRSSVRGPWPLTALFRWLERRARYVPWAQVADPGDDGPLVVRGDASALRPPLPGPRPC